MKLNELTIEIAREKLDKGEINSVDLTKACLERIKELNPVLNACITVCEESALLEAEKADERIKVGEKGSLLGIPYLCKDILMTKGIKTTAASKILENYIAPYGATVVKKLKEAGAVLLGKTNLDEFAHGASTENSAFGPTKNPWDIERVPGGSSGGSAAAVAANMCLFALGSDTGGSIRQPASFCGLVGLKPSYGRVSRFGLLSMTSSTDSIGPLAKTVIDAGMVLEIIAGQDDMDATSAVELVEKVDTSNRDIEGLKIGLPKEYLKKIDPEIKKVLDKTVEYLKNKGAEVIDISLPHSKYGVPVYYIITPSEISSNLARFDGVGWGLSQNDTKDIIEYYKKNRGAGFGDEVKRRVMLGTYALSAGYYDAYYKKAQLVRTLIKDDFEKAFEKVDVILTPTSPHTAFKIGEQVDDPLSMYLEDVYNIGASLSGLPAISVPMDMIDGLPIGLQLISPRMQEKSMLEIAVVIEENGSKEKISI